MTQRRSRAAEMPLVASLTSPPGEPDAARMPDSGPAAAPRAPRGRRAPRHLLLGATARLTPFAPGVQQLTLSTHASRALGMVVTPYVIGAVLLDTGFSIVGDLVHAALANQRIDLICCTHQHEDHTGNAGPLAREHGCPLYMHRPELRWQEGVTRALPYRRMVWGLPHPYSPEPMPRRIDAGHTTLRRVLTPGHSASQVALFDEETGWVYVSDLYLSGGVAPVMTHESPAAQVASLRRVAALEPTRMLNGHGGVWDEPAPRLRVKAERIEERAAAVEALHRHGLDEEEILRRAFPDTRREELAWRWLTSGEFSRLNFVRACIREAEAEAA